MMAIGAAVASDGGRSSGSRVVADFRDLRVGVLAAAWR